MEERKYNLPEQNAPVEKVFAGGKVCLLPGMSFKCNSPFANSEEPEIMTVDFLGYKETAPNDLFVRILGNALEIEIHIAELEGLTDEIGNPATFGLIVDWERKIWGFESAEDGYINLFPPDGEMGMLNQNIMAAEVVDIINLNVPKKYRFPLRSIEETLSLNDLAASA